VRFSKPRDPTPHLGQLEIAVLRELWKRAEGDEPRAADARAVLASLTDRDITISTMQATLERLHRKGLVARSKVGRAYRYSAAVSQSRLIGALIRQMTQQIAAGELEPVISGFVDLIGSDQPELLEQLGVAANKRREEPR
jgi:predicted transcriptional regulator